MTMVPSLAVTHSPLASSLSNDPSNQSIGLLLGAMTMAPKSAQAIATVVMMVGGRGGRERAELGGAGRGRVGQGGVRGVLGMDTEGAGTEAAVSPLLLPVGRPPLLIYLLLHQHTPAPTTHARPTSSLCSPAASL